ncbi:histidine phosphatase family protein [Mesorhizobium plurifarium]|nr:histidine phosphatase family protein [Mesorhizobium plurifarium]PST18874.1 histidine phosphatase family protein [Mesorhizobium plurifarium]
MLNDRPATDAPSPRAEISRDVPYPPILLIRHAETQWNQEGRLQGRGDTPLTLNGVRQSLAVATALQQHVIRHRPVRYWVSPLGRARQTASLLSDCWAIPFHSFVEEPALAERAYGEWEGKTLAEVEAERPTEFGEHERDRWGYRPPRGESKADVGARIETWLRSIDPSARHVVVTHSGCFRAIRGICTNATRRQMDAYREPQTTAYFLAEGGETEIPLDAPIARAFGVLEQTKTVHI